MRTLFMTIRRHQFIRIFIIILNYIKIICGILFPYLIEIKYFYFLFLLTFRVRADLLWVEILESVCHHIFFIYLLVAIKAEGKNILNET